MGESSGRTHTRGTERNIDVYETLLYYTQTGKQRRDYIFLQEIERRTLKRKRKGQCFENRAQQKYNKNKFIFFLEQKEREREQNELKKERRKKKRNGERLFTVTNNI